MMPSLTFDEIVSDASLDQDQYDYLLTNILSAWDTGSASMIRTLSAPMSAGKTYTLGRATIPCLAHQNPSARVFMYSSPRGDLTKVFYRDMVDYLGFKDVTCVNGEVNSFEVYNNEAMSSLLDNIEKANRRGKSTEEYIGNTVIVLSVTIQWLAKHEHRMTKLLKIDYAFFDEAHIGLQIGDTTPGGINDDTGRYLPSDYDPSWKPLAEKLAQNGTKTLAISATLSKSQLAKTEAGAITFLPLPEMPKRKEKQSFPKAHFCNDVHSILSKFKIFHKNRLTETLRLISQIEEKTWQEAKKINILPMLGRVLVKAGQAGATTGISLFDDGERLHNELRDHVKSLHTPGIFSVSTSKCITFKKMISSYFKTEKIDNKRKMEHVIDKLNDPINGMNPAVLAVMNMGNVGINILDIDCVVYLTSPKNPGFVVASQVQTMGRGNRFPFKGMRSHDQMRQLINSLSISLKQKYALAQYVAHKCETHIFAVRTSLMEEAYFQYSKNTMTFDEGLQYYMSHLTLSSPSYTRLIAKPSYKLKYDANKLNQEYKECQCSACPKHPDTNIPFCEIVTRASVESRIGKLSDDEWKVIAIRMVQLNHLKDGRHDYSPNNLESVCANFHAVITEINKDHLCHYEGTARISVSIDYPKYSQLLL